MFKTKKKKYFILLFYPNNREKIEFLNKKFVNTIFVSTHYMKI